METSPTGTSDTPGAAATETSRIDLDALGLGSLPHTRRRAPTDRMTRRLALAVGGALLFFFVGVRLGHGSRPPTPPTPPTTAAAPAAGGPAAPAVTGAVRVVEGNNRYVTDANGIVVKVVTSDSTTMSKTGPVTVRGIEPGDTVVVHGDRHEDGSVSATGLDATADEPLER